MVENGVVDLEEDEVDIEKLAEIEAEKVPTTILTRLTIYRSLKKNVKNVKKQNYLKTSPNHLLVMVNLSHLRSPRNQKSLRKVARRLRHHVRLTL